MENCSINEHLIQDGSQTDRIYTHKYATATCGLRRFPSEIRFVGFLEIKADNSLSKQQTYVAVLILEKKIQFDIAF